MPATPIIALLTSPWVIFLIVAVVVLLFGGKKIPELARGFARARHELKKATDEVEREFDRDDEEEMRREARRKIIEEEERTKRREEVEAGKK